MKIRSLIASVCIASVLCGALASCKTLTPEDKSELVPTTESFDGGKVPPSAADVTGEDGGPGSISDYTGSWDILEDCTIDPFLKEMSDKALTGTGLEALLVLGIQPVAGANYCFLCKDPAGYRLVYIYEDLDDTITITKTVDLPWEGQDNTWTMPGSVTSGDEIVSFRGVTDGNGLMYEPLAFLGSKDGKNCFLVAAIPEEPDSPAYQVIQRIVYAGAGEDTVTGTDLSIADLA